MTKNDLHEKRRFRRFPLSKKDALYCVVVKTKFSDKTIALSTVDFSQAGFQFTVISDLKNDFLKGDKLFLKSITGTRNLTFSESIELSIRWQHHDRRRDIVNIGCKISNIGTESEKQLIEFIKAEVKFKGIRAQDHTFEKPGTSDSIQIEAQNKGQENSEFLRVVSILGSPFQEDNTATILGWVEKQLESAGHHIERIDLYSKDVNGCLGCLQCQENSNEPGCVQIDDTLGIIDSMLSCDLIIYASPVYYTGFSSQMKALIDRCLCLYRGTCSDPDHLSFIDGKRQALIVTTPDSFVDIAEQTLATYRKMVDCHKVISAGEFFACNCDNQNEIGEKIRSQALQFAGQLFDEGKTPYAVFIPR